MDRRTIKINGVDWPLDMVSRHLKRGILRFSAEFQYERRCSACAKTFKNEQECWWPADRENFYISTAGGKLKIGECLSCYHRRQFERSEKKRGYRPKRDQVLKSGWESLFEGTRTIRYEPYRPSDICEKPLNQA